MAAKGVHAVASHVRSIKRHVPPTFTEDWLMLDEAADCLLALQKRAEAAEAEEAAMTEANAVLQRTVNDQARRLVKVMAQRDELLAAIATFIGAQPHGTLADDLRLLHELHVKYVAGGPSMLGDGR